MRLEFYSRYVNILIGDSHKLIDEAETEQFINLDTAGSYDPAEEVEDDFFEDEPDMRFGFRHQQKGD